MEDIRVIISSHNPSLIQSGSSGPNNKLVLPTSSNIPDLFFDEVLVEFKLSRIEVLVLMYFYRVTWCRPNLHVKHGITPIMSHEEVSSNLDITIEQLLQTVKKLETYGFIEVIRAGQYFVRKYFTEDNDNKYGQNYDNFF